MIGVLTGVALSFGVSSAMAQDPPPLSPRCTAPNSDIAAPAPLPGLASRLANGGPLRILAIGSSATWGIGASARARTYPTQLKAILQSALHGVDAEIVNRGVSGEVAKASAERLRTEVALQKPDLVLWQVGTNDALSRVPPEEFEKTIRDTVDWLKSDGIDVVLVGLQYTPRSVRDDNYHVIREALQRVAAAENVLYIRRDDAMTFIAQRYGNADTSPDDGLSLGDLGYPCLAEHVAHAVIANLFVRGRDLPKDQPQAAPKN
ncbi:MAG TPA: SGNH/GDSL hydrolase family protein [Beijerinckiaceae bacterium]|nr:SGNH/GDSL hydrolase family protein [Beijerinckiaceae bacterium]